MRVVDTQIYNRSRALPCPDCGSKNWTKVKLGSTHYYRCWDCDHTWKGSSNDSRNRKKEAARASKRDSSY